MALIVYLIANRQTTDYEVDKPTVPALAIPAPIADSSNYRQAPHKDGPSPTSTTLEAAIPTVRPDQRIALLNEAGRNLKHVYDKALQSTDASENIDALIAARECETFINSDPSTIESDIMAKAPESATKPLQLLAAKALVKRCGGFVAQSDALSSRSVLEQRLLTMYPSLLEAKALSSKVLANGAMTDAERSAWCNFAGKASTDPILFYFIEPAIGEDIAIAVKGMRAASPGAVDVMRNILVAQISCTASRSCETYNTETLLACAYFGECSRARGSYALNPNYSVEVHKKALEFQSKFNANGNGRSCYGSN